MPVSGASESSRRAPTRLRSALVGGGIALVGILVALGSLLVVQRVGGDLTAAVDFRRGADAPAWFVVALLCVIGTALAAGGIAVVRIGWRAAAVADRDSARPAD